MLGNPCGSATTASSISRFSARQSGALRDQAVQIIQLSASVDGEARGARAEYQAAAGGQRQAILEQMAQIDPGVVKYGAYATPIGVNQRVLGVYATGGPAPSDPDAAATGPVTKIITVVSEAGATPATTLTAVPGMPQSVETINSFLEDEARDLRQVGARDQAARLAGFAAAL